MIKLILKTFHVIFNFNRTIYIRIYLLSLVYTFSICNSFSQSVDFGSNYGEYIEVFDAKLYYEAYGEGMPLILLHGGLGSIADFSAIIPELSKHFKVIAIDSPGHGRSEKIDSLSYQIMANYIAKMIHILKLEDINILGYSDGAIIGILVSHLVPVKIKKLVFGAGALNPGASRPEGLEMLKNFSVEMLPPIWEESYKRKSPNPEYWEKFIMDSKEMWLEEVWITPSILPEIQTDVLVLFGDRDQFIPLDHAFHIYDLIPNSELCILPNTPHEMFNFPKRTIPVVLNFLNRE